MSFSKLCQFLFSMPNGLLTLSWTQWCFIKISVEAGGGGGGGGILLTRHSSDKDCWYKCISIQQETKLQRPIFYWTNRKIHKQLHLFVPFYKNVGRSREVFAVEIPDQCWVEEPGSNKLLYPFKMSSVLNVNHSIVRIAFRHFHLNHTDTLRHTTTAPKL